MLGGSAKRIIASRFLQGFASVCVGFLAISYSASAEESLPELPPLPADAVSQDSPPSVPELPPLPGDGDPLAMKSEGTGEEMPEIPDLPEATGNSSDAAPLPPPPPPLPAPVIATADDESDDEGYDSLFTFDESEKREIEAEPVPEFKEPVSEPIAKESKHAKKKTVFVPNYKTEHLSPGIYKKEYSDKNRHLPRAQTNSDRVALLIHAAKHAELTAMRALLNDGLSVDAEDEIGNTAIFYAIAVNSVPSVSYLVERGADLSHQNAEGQTPLHYATLYNQPNMVNLLLEKGADSNKEDHKHISAAMLAVMRDGGPLLSVFQHRDALPPRFASLNDGTPLHLAVQSGNIAAVQYFLTHGADVNAQDGMGNTALHLAALYDRSGLARALIDAGADSQIQNNEGLSPMDVAGRYRHYNVLGVFYQFGQVHGSMQPYYPQQAIPAVPTNQTPPTLPQPQTPIGNTGAEQMNAAPIMSPYPARTIQQPVVAGSYDAYIQKMEMQNRTPQPVAPAKPQAYSSGSPRPLLPPNSSP